MLTTLVILLFRQYRLCGSRQLFFQWMCQGISSNALRTGHITMAFFLMVILLGA
jgi:hypothetical protein